MRDPESDDDNPRNILKSQPMDADLVYNQKYQARTIFHEIRAHVTYRLQGVNSPNAQHNQFGENHGRVILNNDSDAAKIDSQLQQVIEKEEK